MLYERCRTGGEIGGVPFGPATAEGLAAIKTILELDENLNRLEVMPSSGSAPATIPVDLPTTASVPVLALNPTATQFRHRVAD